MSNEVQKIPTEQEIQALIKEFKEKYEDAKDRANTLLTASVHSLLKSHAFVGHLIQMLNRRIDLSVDTAAVGVIQNKYTLFVNPFFYSAMPIEETIAVLRHEVYHLLNDHLKRVKDREPRLWNVAADMAINPFIPNLPKFDHKKAVEYAMEKYGLSKDDVQKHLPKPDKEGKCASCLMPRDHGLPDGQTAEWYYNSIMNNPVLKQRFQSKKIIIKAFDSSDDPEGSAGGKGQKDKKPGDGQDGQNVKDQLDNGKATFDVKGDGEHDTWQDTQAHSQQLVDEELKRIIRDAKDRSPKSFGLLPGDMASIVSDFLKSKNNWKGTLRRWVQVMTDSIRVSTRKRPSRRYGNAYPGQRTDYILKLAVVADSSGSISDKELALMGGEINRIHETKIANITIIVADTQVQKVYKMKKAIKPKDFKFPGRGGTIAQPWLDEADKQEVDAVIILTDGEFSYNLKKPKCAVLWALTMNGMSADQFRKQVPFGHVIKLDLEGLDG